MPCPVVSKRSRGFTLTELAIVLGIFSFIVAAVWAAGSDARKSARVRLGTDDVMIAVTNMRGYAAGMSSYPNYGTLGANSNVTTNMVSSGIVPQNLLSGGTPYDEWNGLFTVYTGVSGTTFRVYMYNVPTDDCRKLIAGIVTANGLGAIQSSAGWTMMNQAVYNGANPGGYAAVGTYDPSTFACPPDTTVIPNQAIVGLEFSLFDMAM
jgi:prepilin-type N-terminal cleavage/methylation domain-containing protein